MKDSTTFKTLEYLGLYPYIEYEKIKGGSTYKFWVVDQGDSSKYASLKSWLNGNALERH